MTLSGGVEGVGRQASHDGGRQSDRLKQDEGLIERAGHAHRRGNAHGLHSPTAVLEAIQ